MFGLIVWKKHTLWVALASLRKEYKVRQAGDGSVFIPDLLERQVENMDQVLDLMAIADKNRTSATTKMNDQSSRSHMVLSVFVRGFNKPANIEYRGITFFFKIWTHNCTTFQNKKMLS